MKDTLTQIQKILSTYGRDLGVRYVVSTSKAYTTHKNREASAVFNYVYNKK
jgi:hypothetical protein